MDTAFFSGTFQHGETWLNYKLICIENKRFSGKIVENLLKNA
jgi:hypothetical protein